MGTEEVVESVPAEEVPSLEENKIIRQIEYYFGNYNLCRDKFLRQQIAADDGWVPLETLIKFNRLKQLTEDFAVIAGALKKSPRQLMEINEDCTKIRRRVAEPIPDDYHERQEMLDKKTVYVKGFKKTNTLDELLDFFKDHNVEHVMMRRNFRVNDKPFKGSVFVTFETEEAAQKFLETKGIKYNGMELLKEWKNDYVKRKDEFYKNLKEEKAKKLEDKMAAMKEKNNDLKMIPGCLLRVTGLESDVQRENLKEVFEAHGTVVYVDYHRGQPSAVIRFESGIAKSVWDQLTEEEGGARKVKVCSSNAEVFLLEGDEETEYWKNIEVSRAQSRLKFNKGFKNQHHRGGGNKGRFKHWGKRKGNNDRGQDTEEGGPQQKKIKTEDIKTETKAEANVEAES